MGTDVLAPDTPVGMVFAQDVASVGYTRAALVGEKYLRLSGG